MHTPSPLFLVLPIALLCLAEVLSLLNATRIRIRDFLFVFVCFFLLLVFNGVPQKQKEHKEVEFGLVGRIIVY